MTEEKETTELSGTSVLIELLGMAISYLLHARGRADIALSRVMLIRIGMGLAEQPLGLRECIVVWRKEMTHLPNDLMLTKSALERLRETGLPDEFALIDHAASLSDRIPFAILVTLCRNGQDDAVSSLLMAAQDDAESRLREVGEVLELTSGLQRSALSSSLLDVQGRFERLVAALEYELSLCRSLYDIAIRASGIGKLM